MEIISDGWLDQTYNTLLNEQTRLLSELRNVPESFGDNDQLHSKITVIMKALLKFKAARVKIRLKE